MYWKNGWFDEHHPAKPKNAKPIDDSRYVELMEDKKAGKIIISDSNGLPVAVDNDSVMTLAQRVLKKMNEIDLAVEAAIVAGFYSAALGDSHFYPGNRDSQLNLIGAVSTGEAMAYPCADDHDQWSRRGHTAQQLQQVLADGASRKQQLLVHADTLRTQVESAHEGTLDAVVVSFTGV